MSESPTPEGPYVPTPEDYAFAKYVLDYQEGYLEGSIRHDYDDRARSVGDDHVLTVLEREGFFAGNTPVLDVGCGPSPHVGYHLRERLRDRDVHFLDVNPAFLQLHKRIYRGIQHAEQTGEGTLREHWLLGDALDEPYLLTHKAVLVHYDLPRFRDSTGSLAPDTPETMRVTLDGLLSALPERLALYLDGSDDPRYPGRTSRVLPALDQLGATYRVVEGVASADFTPREGGYLVLLTP